MYSVIDICIFDFILMFLILVYEDYVFFIIFCLNLKIVINELFVLFIGYEMFKFI